MARKKMRKFASGDEIVVSGKKLATPEFNSFDLERLTRSAPHMDGGGGGGGLGGGSGGNRLAASQRFTSTPDSQGSKFSLGKTYTAAGPVYGPKYSDEDFSIGAGLGRGVLGNPEAPMFGATGSLRFKKGGKVKKMAKGGSTASKRADGCATKGKTKGRFV